MPPKLPSPWCTWSVHSPPFEPRKDMWTLWSPFMWLSYYLVDLAFSNAVSTSVRGPHPGRLEEWPGPSWFQTSDGCSSFCLKVSAVTKGPTVDILACVSGARAPLGRGGIAAVEMCRSTSDRHWQTVFQNVDLESKRRGKLQGLHVLTSCWYWSCDFVWLFQRLGRRVGV